MEIVAQVGREWRRREGNGTEGHPVPPSNRVNVILEMRKKTGVEIRLEPKSLDYVTNFPLICWEPLFTLDPVRNTVHWITGGKKKKKGEGVTRL